MQLEKWKLTALALVGFAFTAFGIWQVNVPVDEQLITDLVSLIFTLLGGIFNVIAARLTPAR